MSKKRFFKRYRKQCVGCNKGQRVCIPKPDPKNGFRNAKVMFVLERPGRRGAGASKKISFDNKDHTAKRFKKHFYETGLDRKDIFITNACIYFPKNKSYGKAPTRLKCCAKILRKQIKFIRPKLIVSLGVTAIRTLRLVFPKSVRLRKFTTLKREVERHDRLIRAGRYGIYAVYHTSSNWMKRSEEKQKEDWRMIPKYLAMLSKPASDMKGSSALAKRR